jgi:hypothetical protein
MPNINKTNIPSPSAEYQSFIEELMETVKKGISQFSLIGIIRTKIMGF